MRDRFFYLIALIAIVIIVGLALLPGRGKAQLNDQYILDNGFILSGNDLMKLTAAPATQIEFAVGADGTVETAILSSIMPKNKAPLSAGVFGTLGSNYERLFAGKQLEITVRARAGAKKPLRRFELGYFTAGSGDSAWNPFELGPDYQNYSFRFKPKAVAGDPGIDYIGIWPGKKGRADTMEVESVKVKIVSP